jgi:FkbM family methyltransferase
MKCDDLVFDVGMHRGEDTEHYLTRGFRVVAIEANPALVAATRERFADAISAGRLTVVGAAVAEEPGVVELAVSDEITIWSSLDPAFIARNRAGGTQYRKVEVPAVCFGDLLAEYGVPHYLKVDIEGSDMLCVRALHDLHERPDYVSIESSVTSPRSGPQAVFDELAELWTLGYRAFSYVDQSRYGQVDSRFARGSSGPFGEEIPGRWAPIGPTLARAAALSLHFQFAGYGSRLGETVPSRIYRKFREDVLHRPLGWYDLHAKLGPGQHRPRTGSK